jgi:hypothetical protein
MDSKSESGLKNYFDVDTLKSQYAENKKRECEDVNLGNLIRYISRELSTSGRVYISLKPLVVNECVFLSNADYIGYVEDIIKELKLKMNYQIDRDGGYIFTFKE